MNLSLLSYYPMVKEQLCGRLASMVLNLRESYQSVNGSPREVLCFAFDHLYLDAQSTSLL